AFLVPCLYEKGDSLSLLIIQRAFNYAGSYLQLISNPDGGMKFMFLFDQYPAGGHRMILQIGKPVINSRKPWWSDGGISRTKLGRGFLRVQRMVVPYGLDKLPD